MGPDSLNNNLEIKKEVLIVKNFLFSLKYIWPDSADIAPRYKYGYFKNYTFLSFLLKVYI